jgi:hypothetical protein
MMKAGTCFVAAGLALVLFMFAGARPVVAAGTCPPNGQPYNTTGFASRSDTNDKNSNYHVGWANTAPGPSGAFGGVMADIKVMDPWVKPQLPGSVVPQFVTAWVMLNTTTPTNTTGDWVQAGWIQQENNVSEGWFEGWNGLPAPLDDKYYPITVGSTPTFKVLYKYASGNSISGFISPDPNPKETYPINWTPNSGQIFSENTTRASAMPGNIGSPESFTNSQVWVGTPGTLNGVWQNFAGFRSSDNSSWWGEWDDGSSSMYTADWACAAQPPGGKYNPITPARLWDTRVNGGRLNSGGRLDVQVTGQGGVPPSGVSAAILNITVTGESGPGNISVVPYGMPQSQTSTLNYLPNQTISNSTEVAMGAGGKTSVYAYGGSTDVIVDVGGWVSAPGTAGSDGLFNPALSARILDTRNGTGGRSTPLGPGQTFALQVAGQGGVPSSGVEAVALNVTVTGGTGASYLVLWDDGSPRPPTSNMNFTTGQTLAHRDVVKLGSNGKIDILNAAGSVNVIADVNGWYTDTSGIQTSGVRFVPLNLPIRIYDSRNFDSRNITGQLGPATFRRLHVGGIVGSPIPPSVSAAPPTCVVLNVTVTNPTAASYLTIYPDGFGQPPTSDINFLGGETRANMVVVAELNDYTEIYNAAGSTDIIVDVLGFYD